jgi:hypothetical protein
MVSILMGSWEPVRTADCQRTERMECACKIPGQEFADHEKSHTLFAATRTHFYTFWRWKLSLDQQLSPTTNGL